MFKITADCDGCGECTDVCPANAIVPSADRYVITVACTNCGECIETCPSSAIEQE